MYDYITLTDSSDISRITFVYSEPQDGIRKREYLAEKNYSKFTVTSTNTSGDTKTEHISEQEFFFTFGKAVARISGNVPGNISER